MEIVDPSPGPIYDSPNSNSSNDFTNLGTYSLCDFGSRNSWHENKNNVDANTPYFNHLFIITQFKNQHLSLQNKFWVVHYPLTPDQIRQTFYLQ